MVLHAHKTCKDEPVVVRFICARHRDFKSPRGGKRYHTEDCPAEGQFSIRLSIVEEAVWGHIINALADPSTIPEAYERLNKQEEQIEVQRAGRIRTLAKLIDEATARRTKYMDTIGIAEDPEVRAGLVKLATEESANIRVWEKERQRIELETLHKRNDAEAIRSTVKEINSKLAHMVIASVKEKRALVGSLEVKVAAYRMDHDPWFEMASSVPGLEASWHIMRRQRAQPEAVLDDKPLLSERVLSETIHKWTAPIPTELAPTRREDTPAKKDAKAHNHHEQNGVHSEGKQKVETAS